MDTGELNWNQYSIMKLKARKHEAETSKTYFMLWTDNVKTKCDAHFIKLWK